MKLHLAIHKITFFLIFNVLCNFSFSQDINYYGVGANQTNDYIEDLINLNVGFVGNHTSLIKNKKGKYTHTVDSLISLKIGIKRIFSPEHGFRGEADAGELINNNIDPKTGIKIISLYGKNKKPTNKQLKGLDVIIFDIQDVGARFYTYISTLHYVMEAAAENNIKLIVFDRPNPNGHYVDGPLRKLDLKSFIGMHPVPIVHGMTIGEYALMINNEGWLESNVKCDLKIIQMKNYNRYITYNLPVKPSPNLPNHKSINLYPSLCLFEGTNVSVGRGTNLQFQVIGNPNWENYDFTFTPKSMPGAKYPKHINSKCYGLDLRKYEKLNEINLKWLILAYNKSKNKTSFFLESFNKLAGTYDLKKQIIEGKNEKQIKKSWKSDLKKFNNIRVKYLLYD